MVTLEQATNRTGTVSLLRSLQASVEIGKKINKVTAVLIKEIKQDSVMESKGKGQRKSSLTVSYTHLTLPTIYSV